MDIDRTDGCYNCRRNTAVPCGAGTASRTCSQCSATRKIRPYSNRRQVVAYFRIIALQGKYPEAWMDTRRRDRSCCARAAARKRRKIRGRSTRRALHFRVQPLRYAVPSRRSLLFRRSPTQGALFWPAVWCSLGLLTAPRSWTAQNYSGNISQRESADARLGLGTRECAKHWSWDIFSRRHSHALKSA